MLKYLWRKWVGDAVARSVAGRLQLEERFRALESRVSTAGQGRDAAPVGAALSGNVVEFKGLRLEFEGETGDGYVENLEAFHRDNGQLLWALKDLPKDASAIDVGANVGLTTALLGATAYAGTVFAFEPSPRTVPHLRRNLARNGIANVEVFPVAVGDAPGVVKLALPPSGAHSHVLATDTEGPNVASVEIITLDNWAEAKGIRRLDFIKLDVEGYEANVLVGAADLIATFRPSILMEFNSVTICFEALVSPVTLAEALHRLFILYQANENGTRAELSNMRDFAYANLVSNGFVEDILMLPRPEITAAEIRSVLAPILAARADRGRT